MVTEHELLQKIIVTVLPVFKVYIFPTIIANLVSGGLSRYLRNTMAVGSMRSTSRKALNVTGFVKRGQAFHTHLNYQL